MVLVGEKKLECVPPVRQRQLVFGLAATEMDMVEIGRDRLAEGWRPGIDCVHTLSHQPGLTAFDFLVRRPRFAPWRLPQSAPLTAAGNDEGTPA